MTRSLASCALLASLPALFCFPVSAQERSVGVPRLEFYDLAPMLRPLPGVQRKFDEPGWFVVPSGWVTPTGDNGGGFGELDIAHSGVSASRERVPSIWIDEILSALGDIVGDYELEPLEERFALRAPPEVHAAVRTRLAELDALTRQEISIEVYELAVVPDAAFQDAATAQQLAAIGTKVLERTVFADVPDFIHSGRAIAYVRDFDVEVAQDSKIGDPKADIVFSGHRLGIAVTPLADGRHFVRLGLSRSEVAQPVDSRSDFGAESGALQLPQVAVSEARTAAVLADGGGVAIAAGDSSHSGVFVVVVTARPGAVALPKDAVPLGIAATPRLFTEPLRASLAYSRDGSLFSRDKRDQQPDLDAYLQLISDGVVGGQEQPPVLVGKYAMIQDRDVRAAVEATVRKDSESMRVRSMRWACGSVDRASWDGAREGDLGALARSLSAQGVLPMLAGQPFQGAIGTELSFLRDYEVEIAREAACGNPVVGRAFDGVSFRGFLCDGGDDGLVLESEWRWSVAAIGASRRVGIKELGELHLPDVAISEAASSQRVSAGEWTVLSAQPDPRDSRYVVLMMARVE